MRILRKAFAAGFSAASVIAVAKKTTWRSCWLELAAKRREAESAKAAESLCRAVLHCNVASAVRNVASTITSRLCKLKLVAENRRRKTNPFQAAALGISGARAFCFSAVSGNSAGRWCRARARLVSSRESAIASVEDVSSKRQNTCDTNSPNLSSLSSLPRRETERQSVLQNLSFGLARRTHSWKGALEVRPKRIHFLACSARPRESAQAWKTNGPSSDTAGHVESRRNAKIRDEQSRNCAFPRSHAHHFAGQTPKAPRTIKGFRKQPTT